MSCHLLGYYTCMTTSNPDKKNPLSFSAIQTGEKKSQINCSGHQELRDAELQTQVQLTPIDSILQTTAGGKILEVIGSTISTQDTSKNVQNQRAMLTSMGILYETGQ